MPIGNVFATGRRTGLSEKIPTRSGQAGSNPVQPGDWLTTQFVFCPSLHSFGPPVLGFLAQLVEHSVGTEWQQVQILRCPTLLLARTFFDGSQNWVIACHARSRRFDPNDRGMMDVVGFDTSAPAVISDFIRN